jgi:hypothetical protein
MAAAKLVTVPTEGFMDELIPPYIPKPTEPRVTFRGVEFREQYAFVVVHVFWDDGNTDLGACNIKVRLPVPMGATEDLPGLKAWAIREVTGALNIPALRAARPPIP